jgi:DNA-binding transcriptional MocR family regulator
MTIWTPDLAQYGSPKYRALTEAIASAIADGTLSAGSKLPPQRELAYVLGLSIGTVTRAYKDAERRDLVVGEIGRGTFVRPDNTRTDGETSGSLWAPTRDTTGPISLIMNLPPVGIAAPALADTLRDLSRSGDLGSLLDHQSNGRTDVHLNSAALWLGRIGLEATAEDIVLTNGAQHGILMALMASAHPGDTVLAENLTYPPLKQMAWHFGLKLQGLEMDAQGIIPDALDAACVRTNARVLYCMPTLQSPTGITMPEARRWDIARIAQKHDLTVIEDDVFGFLPQDRPPPLAVFVPERTLFVTSVSKSLAPGLRIGIVRATARHREALRNAVQMSCWMPSPITAEITHRWIQDGTADLLNNWLRQEMKARCALARKTLGPVAAGLQDSSYHLWLKLPESWSEEAFRSSAEQRGVKVAIGETFQLKSGTSPRSLRLALGYETSQARLETGLKIICEIMNSHGAGQASIV